MCEFCYTSLKLNLVVLLQKVGVLEAAFNYDFPINLVFQLNNTEINLIIFTSAVVLAAAVICCLHIRYQVGCPAHSTFFSVELFAGLLSTRT